MPPTKGRQKTTINQEMEKNNTVIWETQKKKEMSKKRKKGK
jgi:hypothetical protein